MPYKSDAQRRYFNANRAELEAQGVDVDEWNAASKGKKLPEKTKKKDGEPAKEPADKTASLAGQRGQLVASDGANLNVWWSLDGQRVTRMDVTVPDVDEVGLLGLAKHAQLNPAWLDDVKLGKEAETLTPTTGLSSAPQSPQLPQNSTPAARLKAQRQQALTNMRLMTPQGVKQTQTATATGPPTMNSTQNILSGMPSVDETTGRQRHWGNALPQIFGITLSDTKLAADSAATCAICAFPALEKLAAEPKLDVNNPPAPKPLGQVKQKDIPEPMQISLQARHGVKPNQRYGATEVTQAHSLAPYYAGIKGGLAGAARKATAYNAAGNAPKDAPGIDLSPERLLRPITEYVGPRDPAYGFVPELGAEQMFVKRQPKKNKVMKVSGPSQQAATREHEGTHTLQTKREDYVPTWERGPGVTRKDVEWDSLPSELDAYAAGPIKRLYAQHTGKLVTTPEEAAEAIQWYKDVIGEDPEGVWGDLPEDSQLKLWDTYQSSPGDMTTPWTPEQEKYLRQRMPGIVRNQQYPALEKMSFSLNPFKAPEPVEDEEEKKKKQRSWWQPQHTGMLMGAGAGSLPLISALQDKHTTYPFLRRELETAPIYTKHKDIAKRMAPGDFFASMGKPKPFFDDKGFNFGAFNAGGEWTSGSGAYHAGMTRPAARGAEGPLDLLEGGNLGWTDAYQKWMKKQPEWKELGMDIDDWNPAGAARSRFGQAVSAIQPAMESDEGFIKGMQKHLKANRVAADLAKRFGEQRMAQPGGMEGIYGHELSGPAIVSRSPRVHELMTNPATKGEMGDWLDKFFKTRSLAPYDDLQGVAVGLRRLMLPRMNMSQYTTPEPKNIKGFKPPELCDMVGGGAHCSGPGGEMLGMLGSPTGSNPKFSSPVDLAASPRHQTVGIYAPDTSREELLSWLDQSQSRRFKLGLGLAALLGLGVGGAGYLGHRALQNWRKPKKNEEDEEKQGHVKLAEGLTGVPPFKWMPRINGMYIPGAVGAGVGAGVGALTDKDRLRGAGHGAFRGAGTELGAMLGGAGGAGLGLLASLAMAPYTGSDVVPWGMGIGGTVGAGLGGVGGYKMTRWLSDQFRRPDEEEEQ